MCDFNDIFLFSFDGYGHFILLKAARKSTCNQASMLLSGGNYRTSGNLDEEGVFWDYDMADCRLPLGPSLHFSSRLIQHLSEGILTMRRKSMTDP